MKMKSRREELGALSSERLIDFIEMCAKNFWTLQNNWMANTERRFGVEVAAEMDALCYGRASEVMVHRAKKFFKLGGTMFDLAKILNTSISAMYVDFEFPELSEKRMVRRVRACPMQMTRLQQGLPELPCKEPAIRTYQRIANAHNSRIRVVSVTAPPDPHPEDRWCDVVLEIVD